jgi:hypothetical protein
MVVVVVVVVCVSVSVSWAAARILPANPVGSVRPVFPFPDGDVFLDAIDEQATSAKCLVPMSRTGRTNDGSVSHLEGAYPMERRQADTRDFSFDLSRNFSHLLFGHALVCLVFQQGDRFSIIVISDGAKEDGDAPDLVCGDGVEHLT